MMQNKNLSNIAFYLSIITLVIAAVVSIFQLTSLWLAGTQWILISIVFGVYALYFRSGNATGVNG